jgi:release factor glutamine methyltransferase
MSFSIAEALRGAPLPLDTAILLSFVLKKPRVFLMSHPEYALTSQEAQEFQTLLQKRQEGVPIAYLTGHKEFWSLDFHVTPDVLIPRPETELCVEAALTLVTHPKAHVADIGTGSGCIAIALAKERPHWQITAIDLLAPALAIAEYNAKIHRCTNIVLKQGNGLAGFAAHSLDAVISNPPYIGAEDPHLEPDVKNYEPLTALIAADHGYALLFQIAKEAYSVLKPQGWLILEHGRGQEVRLSEHLSTLGYQEIRSIPDFQNIQRVTVARTAV